jgi:hypothetical protein
MEHLTIDLKFEKEDFVTLASILFEYSLESSATDVEISIVDVSFIRAAFIDVEFICPECSTAYWMVILLPLFLRVYFDTHSVQNSRSIGRWSVAFQILIFLGTKNLN